MLYEKHDGGRLSRADEMVCRFQFILDHYLCRQEWTQTPYFALAGSNFGIPSVSGPSTAFRWWRWGTRFLSAQCLYDVVNRLKYRLRQRDLDIFQIVQSLSIFLQTVRAVFGFGCLRTKTVGHQRTI